MLFRSRFRTALLRWQPLVVELLNYRRDGSRFWTEIKASPLADPHGRFTHWVSVQRDVTSRRSTEQRLWQQAFSDPLTALPNRRSMAAHLDRCLARGRDGSARVALIFCDLDRFKTINDRYGHAVGDAVLLEVCRRLQGQLRPGDMLARIGGDEFVVVAEAIRSDADAMQLAGRLRDALAAPCVHGGETLAITMSFGVATARAGDQNAEELLRRADASMYTVKESGRDGVALHTPDADSIRDEQSLLLLELRQSLRAGGQIGRAHV